MEFVDLQAQRARIKDEIDAGIRRVLDHGRFILGPEWHCLSVRATR
jgi:UDP-2-acetamido-2-deoxy-ribo-hexuluronate aminotransferase